MMLDRDLRTRSRMKRAVIVDIDETIMDNSQYQACADKEPSELQRSDLAGVGESVRSDRHPGRS